MALYDFRKNGGETKDINFYIFDDLRWQQNRNALGDSIGTGPNLYRYDSLEEAIGKIRSLPEYMYPALGFNNGRYGELDVIYRRNGEYHLTPDYKTSGWDHDEDIRNLISSVCQSFKVEWQMFSGPFESRVLIPFVPDTVTDGVHTDKYFAYKMLSPKIPEKYGAPVHPYSSLNEVFVPGEGWLDYLTARAEADKYGFNCPDVLKITQYNINYVQYNRETDTKSYGQADISPLDFNILLERYQIRDGGTRQAAAAVEKLSRELFECIYGSKFVQNEVSRKAHLAEFNEAIYKKETGKIEEKLEKAIENFKSPYMKNKAEFLLFRVRHLFDNGRHPKLDVIIADAEREAAKRSAGEKAAVTKPVKPIENDR